MKWVVNSGTYQFKGMWQQRNLSESHLEVRSLRSCLTTKSSVIPHRLFLCKLRYPSLQAVEQQGCSRGPATGGRDKRNGGRIANLNPTSKVDTCNIASCAKKKKKRKEKGKHEDPPLVFPHCSFTALLLLASFLWFSTFLEAWVCLLLCLRGWEDRRKRGKKQ